MRTVLKYSLFSLIPVVAFSILVELGLRAVLYQSQTAYPLAIIHAASSLQHRLLVSKAERQLHAVFTEISRATGHEVDAERLASAFQTALYGREGRELLASLQRRYEAEFAQFVKEVRHIDAHLVVVSLPSSNVQSASSKGSRAFFRDLTETYQIDLLDPSDLFSQYPVEWVTLYPEDSHLSRFGNALLVTMIADYLTQHAGHRSTASFAERPALLGDLKPQHDSVWQMNPRMPFRVVTNRQGLRMEENLTFPKTRQRILAIGDSFTFGPYLDNQDTYPALLARKLPDTDVMNAGVNGYTITDELRLFRERAKYVEPDMIILQVCPNDLQDLSFVTQRARGKRVNMSEVEQQFLLRISQQL